MKSFPVILKSPSLLFITAANTEEVWKAFLLPRLDSKSTLRGLIFFLLEVPKVSELGWCKHPISPWGLWEVSCRRGTLDKSKQSRPKRRSRRQEPKTDITIQKYAVVPIKGSGPIYTGKRGQKSGPRSRE